MEVGSGFEVEVVAVIKFFFFFFGGGDWRVSKTERQISERRQRRKPQNFILEKPTKSKREKEK